MTIFVDLDGVICTEERTFERPLAKPMPGARESLQALADQGHTIIIYTGRSWSEQRVCQHWLDEHQIPHHGLHMGKPIADVWIDDRAVRFTDWAQTLSDLKLTQTKVPGGPVDEGLLHIIRRRIKSFLHEIAARPDLMEPVLEVGPMVPSGLASPVYSRLTDIFVDSPKLFRDAGKKYLSLDLDAGAKPDVVGDFMNARELFAPESIGSIVILGTMEHIPRIWDVPPLMHYALKPGGRAFILTPWNLRFHGPRPDCWRLSDDAYRALFGKGWTIESLEQIPCPGRPLSPVGFCAIIRKD